MTNKTENNGILNKKSDLSYNPLVDEANHRRNKNSDDIENTVEDNSNIETVGHIAKEKSSKIYTDGEYHKDNNDDGQNNNEDQGYQSSANSPNDSLRRAVQVLF